MRTALLALVALTAVASAAPNQSPHGRPDACTSCHVDNEGGAFVRGTATATCAGCHDEEPHLVGIAPKRARIPESFPLDRGKLGCETCHDEPACDGNTLSADNPRFFRGGPYQRMGDLCAQCHKQTAMERFNPHEAMQSSAAGGDEHACEFCHETVPEPGQATQDLKLPGPETCRGCHYDTMHAGLKEHLVTLDADVAARAKAAGLPLGKGDTVTCLTCHDPHPAGVVPGDQRTAWADRAVVPKPWLDTVLGPSLEKRAGGRAKALTSAGDFLRLRLDDGTLCHACHGNGPHSGGRK